MERKCVALLSGGLDSQLAIKMMQEQGIEVEALNFRTMFSCCKDDASGVARQLGVRLTFVSQGDDYLELIKRPKFGHGTGMNPCVDCRIYMFELAKRMMERVGASFVVSGEVVGQRPMSQMLKQQGVIARESGLEGLLLRPLSAQLLPPTRPEIEGIVDRSRLGAFQGRSRKALLELGERYGLTFDGSASTGCALTDRGFGNKVQDLIAHDAESGRWDFELLKYGRHLRLDESARVILGRDERENLLLDRFYREAPEGAAIWVYPDDWTGPTALIAGPYTQERVQLTGGLIVRYAGNKAPDSPRVRFEHAGGKGAMDIAGPLDDTVIDGMKISLVGGRGASVKKQAVVRG